MNILLLTLVSIALVGIHCWSGKAFGGLPSQLWLLAVAAGLGLVAGTPLEISNGSR